MSENALTCLTCGERIVSRYRHDFVSCACPSETRIFVDGGQDYQRMGWGEKARFRDDAGVEGGADLADLGVGTPQVIKTPEPEPDPMPSMKEELPTALLRSVKRELVLSTILVKRDAKLAYYTQALRDIASGDDVSGIEGALAIARDALAYTDKDNT